MFSLSKKIFWWLVTPPKTKSKGLFIGLMIGQLLLIIINLFCIFLLYKNHLLTKFILSYFIIQIMILLIGFGSYLTVYIRRYKYE